MKQTCENPFSGPQLDGQSTKAMRVTSPVFTDVRNFQTTVYLSTQQPLRLNLYRHATNNIRKQLKRVRTLSYRQHS